MSLQQQLRPLLQQFSNSVGRGNLIVANTTLVRIIEAMAVAIDQPCGCNCAAPIPAKPIEAVTPKPVVDKRGRGRPKKVKH